MSVWDWDLWPWMVAEGADESGLALATLRMEQSVHRAMTAIGGALVPVMRKLGATFADMVDAARALQRSLQREEHFGDALRRTP
jgi:hypothetical protein